jgi:hypothetical protein
MDVLKYKSENDAVALIEKCLQQKLCCFFPLVHFDFTIY